MDQGIINAFKVIYKSNFLRRVLLETDSDRPVTEVIKSFSLYDAIQLATDAWATVTPETIANCWRNLLSQDQNYNSFNDFTISSPTSDPRVLLSKVVQLVDPNYELTEEEVQEWLSNSDNIDVAQIYTDEQLAKYIASGGEFFEADHEEQDCDANESAEGDLSTSVICTLGAVNPKNAMIISRLSASWMYSKIFLLLLVMTVN
ncbi:tigger transposable element-derived protein 6-like [Toxorhynchites rutilus septentrionalis]|uniref:tigger transposable element-derived protein 6-like n=1 Tax=Toxorhynchites rutilus septentrionalis TaxID=329112 RepID=UPI0024796569|nr:tigger transposable element-derived protein 6-like [Toxorhynchites rutilus septentrionalis]